MLLVDFDSVLHTLHDFGVLSFPIGELMGQYNDLEMRTKKLLGRPCGRKLRNPRERSWRGKLS